jgi:hypothetical protein
MLDQVWIFTKTGVLLYHESWAPVKGKFVGGSIVNALIRTVLLEEKAGASQVSRKLDREEWGGV